jgi:hypothetical protein
MGHTEADEPITKPFETIDERLELPRLDRSCPARTGRPNARNDSRLVNIETGNPVMQHFHTRPLYYVHIGISCAVRRSSND